MNVDSIDNKKLRVELEDLKSRISSKITHLVLTHKKLPFERLSKGRQLKELVIMAINEIDHKDGEKLNKYMVELIKQGLKFSEFK